MACGTYFSNDALCPLNNDPLWRAGHLCAQGPGHDGPHACRCGATKERKR